METGENQMNEYLVQHDTFGGILFIFVQSLRQVHIELRFASYLIITTPRIVVNGQSRKLKFGMEALFDQTTS